jgi:formate hydrogenlyase subunit 6/NADH:ubiquinone oxidoreductase subunit I
MGMILESFKNLFSRPYTRRYPGVPADLPERNRGRVEWDMQKCIWCMLCQKNCPTLAIKTDKAAKTQSVTRNRCIACGRCVEVCPTQTIYMKEEYSKPVEVPEIHVYGVDMKQWEYRVEHLDIKRHEKRRGNA